MSRGGAPSKRSAAVGGRPVKALVDAVGSLPGLKPGGIYRVGIRHDDECPTLASQSMRDCTCEIIDVDDPEEVALEQLFFGGEER